MRGELSEPRASASTAFRLAPQAGTVGASRTREFIGLQLLETIAEEGPKSLETVSGADFLAFVNAAGVIVDRNFVDVNAAAP